MPRITATQYHELEEKCQRFEKELTERTLQHMEELKKIQARLAELETEVRKQEEEAEEQQHDIDSLRARLQESDEALQKETEAHGDTKRAWDADSEDYQTRIVYLETTLEHEREHSSNVLAYLLASLVGTFGAAVAAVWSVRCQQEPEL